MEIEHLAQVQDAADWVDVTRKDIPDGLLYSWWSYRAKRLGRGPTKGRRLDHLWATPDIAGASHSSRILRHVRGWEQPSRPRAGSLRPSIFEAKGRQMALVFPLVTGRTQGHIGANLIQRELRHAGTRWGCTGS